MQQKISKAEDYFRTVKGIATGGQYLRNYIDVKMNPDCISFYFKDKKETVNVWEDVRTLINKEFRDTKGVLPTRMLSIVTDRLDWLRGTWKSPFSNEEKSKYIVNFNNYSKFFTNKTINNALSRVNLKDFIELREVYGDTTNYYTDKGYFDVGVCRRERTINTRGRREVITETGTKFLVPNSYQSKEGAFLTNCLNMEYPYLGKYKIQSYKLEQPYEFFVKVEKDENVIGNLYIPYECLKNKTIEPAIKRMTSYFKWYYKNQPEELKKQLGLMDSPTFKALKKDIEG